MSADDNPLDYLHVPNGPVDRAIQNVEDSIAGLMRDIDVSPSLHQVMIAIAEALRELDRGKRERY